VGYARTYVTRPSPWLGYATEAIFPFYIFHQTITVAAVWFLIPWKAGVGLKVVVVMLATFVGSWVLFEVVRRVQWLRPLFGMKRVAS
jgi:glucans biosynthesis protein C